MRFSICARRMASVTGKVGKEFSITGRPGKTVVFSAIQPTGALHIGNYFGAVKFWIDIQNEGIKQFNVPPNECQLIVAIADLHALTTNAIEPNILKQNTLHIAAMLLAAGIDHERTTLFQQSCVPEHTSLAWLLTCLSTVAQLNRLSQFKDKATAYRDGSVPAGLLTYPLLQAADILLYNTSYVPVGEDQTQHLEICQKVAKRFNRTYGGQCLRVPQMVQTEHARMRSLRSPLEKMSKSNADPMGRIDLTDGRKSVRKKIKKAVTDAFGSVTFDPENRPGVSNLITLDCAVSNKTPAEICAQASHLDTGKYKIELASRISDFLAPIQERYRDIVQDAQQLQRILDDGNSKARDIAVARIDTIRRVVGLKS